MFRVFTCFSGLIGEAHFRRSGIVAFQASQVAAAVLALLCVAEPLRRSPRSATLPAGWNSNPPQISQVDGFWWGEADLDKDFREAVRLCYSGKDREQIAQV